MEKLTASVAEVKKRFSDYLSRGAFSDCRIVITKRNRQVAAIVSMKDLQALEQLEKRKGLQSIIGKWDDFDELRDAIDEAMDMRRKESPGRDVSI